MRFLNTLFLLLTLTIQQVFGSLAILPTERKLNQSIQSQAGAHVIYSYSGKTPPNSLFNVIKKGKVGGVIFFSDNVNDDLPSVIANMQSIYTQSPAYMGLPLLMLTDQEGGEVRRVPGGPTDSEKEIGESKQPTSSAKEAGTEACTSLSNYNMNGNLAPVLDVFRQPGDFDDQYQRSYSDDSNVVGECAGAFIPAQQSCGVIATAKHFPGLGAASADQNTDERPVTLNLSLQELQDVDEAPYVSAIKTGIDMVMPSWALYPALDAKYPSGLSSSWIMGELRGRLGFQGVTISDAIEAGGLEGFGDDPKRAVLATQAGMDVILAAAQTVSQGEQIVDELVEAVSNGTLSVQDFNNSTERIRNLRAKIGT